MDLKDKNSCPNVAVPLLNLVRHIYSIYFFLVGYYVLQTLSDRFSLGLVCSQEANEDAIGFEDIKVVVINF